MTIVYGRHYEDIGCFHDTKYIVAMLDRVNKDFHSSGQCRGLHGIRHKRYLACYAECGIFIAMLVVMQNALAPLL